MACLEISCGVSQKNIGQLFGFTGFIGRVRGEFHKLLFEPTRPLGQWRDMVQRIYDIKLML
jgi:hypothetical protein